MSEIETQAPIMEQSLTQTRNGLSQDAARQLDDDIVHFVTNMTSVSQSLNDGSALEDKTEDEQEEEVEENFESSSLEDSPKPDLDMSLTLSPGLSTNHKVAEEERV